MAKCRCGRKAVIFRKYEGTYLCKSHFLRSVEEKAKKTISKYYGITRGEKIAVGVSGGKDSTALLMLLSRLFGKRKDVRLFAVSIDEGIPGYRDDSLEIAKKLCRKLGIEHHVFSFEREFGKPLHKKVKDIDKKTDGGPCTYCGVGRRYLLNRKSRELGATRLALGMNLDDEVQGILMNYMKGDLIRLSRMGNRQNVRSKLFVPRIKPFREIPEKEVGLYAFLKGLEIQEDECPLLEGPRFRVRDFLNEMEKESPGTKFSILKSYDRLMPMLRKGMSRGKYGVETCKKCGEPTSGQSICKTCELWKS